MIHPDFSNVSLQLRKTDGRVSVFDMIRKRWIVLTPEEHVRQYLVHYLTGTLRYPPGMVAVEKQIRVGGLPRRFDIVVYDRRHEPWMLVECKEPEVDISEQTLHQLLHYHNALQCRYWVLGNGRELFCADATDRQRVTWLTRLPAYDL